MLPPLYQRPTGAEIPAMGFSASLKVLVKARLHSSRARWGRDCTRAQWPSRGKGRTAFWRVPPMVGRHHRVSAVRTGFVHHRAKPGLKSTAITSPPGVAVDTSTTADIRLSRLVEYRAGKCEYSLTTRNFDNDGVLNSPDVPAKLSGPLLNMRPRPRAGTLPKWRQPSDAGTRRKNFNCSSSFSS